MKLKQVEKIHKNQNLLENFRSLSSRILNCANRDIPRVDFLKDISKILIDFSGCDLIELLIRIGNSKKRCELIIRTKKTFNFDIISCIFRNTTKNSVHPGENFNLLLKNVITGIFNPSIPFFTKKGSFWKVNAENSFIICSSNKKNKSINSIKENKEYKSFALIPLIVGQERIGILKLNSRHKNCFTEYVIELYEDFTQTLGFALMNQFSQAALRERVKELTCLYGIAQAVENPSTSRDEILQNIVELLPPAWQYPKITCARIMLDDHIYITPGFKEGLYKQSAEIMVKEEKRGEVVVIYTDEKPSIDEGPFLKEERNLINAIAKELALIIERRESEEDKKKLQEQLLHADRLATIGQLAAGVAHELNEPLGNILGFAQLAKKCPKLPLQAQQDIESIITTSLYSREIIKKLMLFTRQTPSKKIPVNLNQIVSDGLYFLESRCSKEGIEIKQSLASNLPTINADPSQLNQVLVNLVVNAVQAMPGGGCLTIKTLSNNNDVSLIVEDTGTGMNQETVKKIFIPFFTTKDIGHGTGLGLAVVHGIVTSHMGTIKVDSQFGRGSKFEIHLPIFKFRK